MTHVNSISKVIRVVPRWLTVPLTCRGLYVWADTILHSTTAIIQGQLKLHRQLKVFKRTLKTAKKWKYGTKNVFMKKIVSKYASE